MPIRFRCQDCKKLLGIAKRKAGTEIICPHCAAFLTVPSQDEVSEQADLDEIDELLSENPPPRPTSPTESQRAVPEKPQLFARNVELAQVLYHPAPPNLMPPQLPPPQRTGVQPTLSRKDALVVLNAKTTTILVVLVAVMVFGAFVAGFLIGAR